LSSVVAGNFKLSKILNQKKFLQKEKRNQHRPAVDSGAAAHSSNA
jgi:hypothetical protein